MDVRYFQVDAFANRLFAGNPAGICLLDAWLPDELLQAIASENNLAETAFLVRRGADYDLRWFTPLVEVDLCGHATLASAHIILRHLSSSEPSVRFHTRSGVLTVTRHDDLLTLDFPSRPAVPCAAPKALIEGLGKTPVEVAKGRDYLAVYPQEQDVRDLRPDMDALMRLDCLGVIVTAPGADCDFVSRFFAPLAGIPEDPVTGSAHCALIPYWSQRLQRSKLRALQVSQRGGELYCEQRGERVGIAGRAVTYSSGLLHLP